MPFELVDYPQETIWTGQWTAASGTTTQLPSIYCNSLKLKAPLSNKGIVWFGFQSGTVNDQTGYPLEAGQETEVINATNLNQVRAFFSRAGDVVCYLLFIHGE